MAKTITIFEAVEVAPASSGRPTYARSGGDAMTKAVERSLEDMQAHMTGFIDGVQAMLSAAANIGGEFQMNTVEVQAQIGLEGKIGFLGSGAAASGSSQIKIVFERKTSSG